MSNYELTYILRPLEEANLSAINERINTLVQNAGGEIVSRHDWGRRRLAYPIRKIADGYYTTLYLTLSGTAVRGIERSLKLNDDVLRFLVVRVDELKPPAAAAAPAAAVEQPAPAAEMPAPTETPAPTEMSEAAPVETAPAQEPAPAAATASDTEGS